MVAERFGRLVEEHDDRCLGPPDPGVEGRGPAQPCARPDKLRADAGPAGIDRCERLERDGLRRRGRVGDDDGLRPVGGVLA